MRHSARACLDQPFTIGELRRFLDGVADSVPDDARVINLDRMQTNQRDDGPPSGVSIEVMWESE